MAWKDEKAAAAAESQYAAGDKQVISITDLISEGPIYGLVDAQSSVFLNDDRASPLSQAAKYASQTATKIFLTNGSTTATILDGGSTPIINATNGDKYITVRAVTSMYVTASNGSTSDANGNTTATLTTQDNAAFFNDTMLSSPTDSPDSKVPVRLLTLNTSHGPSDDGLGEGYLISRTSTSVAEFMPGSGMPAGLWIPDGTYFMCIDRVVKIASISGATITLATAWPHATLGSGVSYHFDVSGAIVSNADVMSQTEIKKYKSITSQFRVGTLGQGPFEGRGGVGATSISNTPSAGGTIEQTTGYGSGSQDAKVLVGSAAAGFNLTTAQLQEVDETAITFNYGGGHKAVSNGGSDKFTYTSYKIELAVKKAGAGDFENYVVLNHPLVHSGKYNNAISFVKTIDLTSFRPFVDFRVKISRISDHTGDGYETSTKRRDGWSNVTSAAISTATSILKEVLTHPYSALAKTTFDTKQFRSVPTRSFHVRGLKVKIPSNYVTREQSGDGIANYRRNISNGDIESTYQDWDGALAFNKVYTNNPAWVFYDILTNNRYGLGDFLQDSDIDIYSLYRIARYCDELVSDGKGGQEPRFTANLYFTKQADAYKVLKDISTVFRAMLYYFDGQITPVIDAPSGPVYNFTKSNVIDGKFSYESTGSKTRINQVLVTWTNPDANYKPEPLIVEDRLNIAATGKIISQDAVAMGAISEGQALRYGRWKLWTAANQRELVNFSTSLNASFLVPGDIINVQDADRGAVRIGGRVSNSGTDISTVSIPLDNPTTLNSGSTYELSIIFVEPAAFATSDVTIAGVDYKKGDIIKQAYLTGSSSLQNIDTETKSLNAKASANATDALVLNWTDTTRVEKQTVSTSAGLTSTLTVSSAFSALPTAETVWVMTEVSGGALTTSSAKAYKILGLAQNSKNEYTITAVEHYDEKFNAVDEDFSTYIADTVYPPVIVTDDVPQPLDVFSTSLMRPEQVGEELTISWTPPANLGSIPGEYEHTFGYEITHDFPDYPNPIRINDSLQTNWSVQGITDGSYNVAVRTINTLNNLSEATRAAVTVSDRYKENIPRMPEGVPYTGTTSVGFGIVSDTFIFKRYAYTVKSPSGVSSSITNTNQTSTAWQQSCSTLPVISWSESDRAAEGEFVKEHAYILLDASNSTDRLKLLKYYRSFGVGFWYDIGSGNTTDKYGSALTGTFSKAADTSKVTGSGTAFLTQIKEGDILKLGSTEGYRVAAVVSDTLLYVTNSFSSFSGVQGFVPNIRIDYANDFIIARVYNTSSGLVLAESYAKIDAVLKPAGDIVEEGGVSTAEIAENAVTVEEIDTSAATGGTFGAAVAALDAASFSSIDTDVLDANSVIAREVQVFPSGATPPTISGTTLAGAGIDLKQDGDLYVGNYSDDKYMFWDQSEGTMTFRGTLNVDDITGSSATFGTLMAEVATIGTLNTKMLDSDAIVTRDIRVGPSAEITAGSFVVGTEYYITDLGNTTQAQWNSVAGTSSVVYNLGSIFTAANAGTGTGKARNRTTVAKIANTTLTGSGAHLNAAGDFYVGNASANKYMFWDQSAGTMTLRGELNADDITAGNITAANINVTNLQAISANLGNITAGTLKGGTIPEASSAPTTTESGTFFDLTGGRMVLGNASKYIWWNGTNLEINGVTISDATLSGSTGFATETFVNTAINNLVANAPAALDTLNEIAAALDDDASFHASVTTSLSNKVGTTSPQALSTAANVMTISGSTISLARANGDTDTVAVPNDNTEYTAGSGLALSGTTFSNSAPDQTVALTGSGATSISGTYPNFTISSSNTNTQRSDEEIRDLAASILTAGTNVSISVNDAANTATISSTNTQYTAGSGLSLSGTQFSNSAPDQTVSLTGAGGATISGTYPNFTISSANSVYTHPAYTPRSINTSGATVLDTFTSDAIGSVTSIGTRTLTLANLGYTGATNANLYVLPGSVVHSTESQALNSDPLRISGSTLSLYKGDGTFDSVTLPSVSPANNTITLTAGVGLSGGGAFTLNQGSNETITLTADLSELPDMTQTFTSTDELVVLDAGVSKRKQTSEIALSTFNNDLTFSAATTLGGQSASHYLNVNTTFGGDVSGKYNAIVIADDSHNHTIANVAGLQTALNGKVDDGQVLTNVPTGALFTDTNTNTITQIREDSGSYRTGNITLQSGTNVSITEPTTGVFRFTSTDTNTVYSHPNHSGDVTSSGDGAQTIANNVVTFAKMQDIATDTFMGRTASGSGDAKALSVSEARTMLNVENGATADQSASEILTLLKTVDSNTSGLNADTLDGQQGTYYYAASNPNSYTSNVGDITAVTVSAPITGGGTSGSVGIAITQASGSANGYLSSTDWTTFNNKSTFNGAYASLSGKPTLLTLGSTSSTALAGNTAIPVDLTTSGAGTVHANNYVNTQYVAATSSAFGLVKIGYSESGKNYPVELSNGQMYVNVPWTDNNDNTITRVKGTGGSLVSGDITITASGAATSTQSGNTINIASVNTNTEYTASDGVELSGTTFSLSTNMNGIALSVDSLAANKIDVGVLDADSVIARDIKVGPSGSEATYGATPSGTGAHITSSGNFYVGDYANDKYMLWNGSTLTIRGSLDANDINGVLLDTGSNRQISIGTTIAPGNQSVLIGPGAGGTGLGSTSLGKFAGGFTTGTDNVAIGQDAGMSVTTGNENIMIGSHTGRAPAGTTANKTGNNNIGIGAVSNQNTANGTLSDLTSGSNNIVFGKGAGRNITTGSGNVIIGGYAGVTNDESTITIATGTGSRRLYFDTSGNATFTGTVTGTRFFTTDGTNTLSTYVSGSSNQITSTGSASGGARDLRFNFGQSGTVMTLKSTQVHMAKTMLLDGATTNSTSTSNIISTANADTSSVTGYHISFTKSNGTTSLGRITTNNYSTTYTTSSDYRLKEDLVEITGATAKVLSIPTRNFKWIGSDVRTDGFLAHELASIVPDAVVGEKDAVDSEGNPDYQGVDQSKLVPLLVKTIQELEARIAALENP